MTVQVICVTAYACLSSSCQILTNSLLVFDCGSDADCYNKGICNIDSGTCLCQLGWDHQSDCTGSSYQGTYEALTFSFYFLTLLYLQNLDVQTTVIVMVKDLAILM